MEKSSGQGRGKGCARSHAPAERVGRPAVGRRGVSWGSRSGRVSHRKAPNPMKPGRRAEWATVRTGGVSWGAAGGHSLCCGTGGPGWLSPHNVCPSKLSSFQSMEYSVFLNQCVISGAAVKRSCLNWADPAAHLMQVSGLQAGLSQVPGGCWGWDRCAQGARRRVPAGDMWSAPDAGRLCRGSPVLPWVARALPVDSQARSLLKGAWGPGQVTWTWNPDLLPPPPPWPPRQTELKQRQSWGAGSVSAETPSWALLATVPGPAPGGG